MQLRRLALPCFHLAKTTTCSPYFLSRVNFASAKKIKKPKSSNNTNNNSEKATKPAATDTSDDTTNESSTVDISNEEAMIDANGEALKISSFVNKTIELESLRFGQTRLNPDSIFATTKYSFAIANPKPIAPGHILIIPKNQNRKRVSDLTFEELSDLINLAKDMSIIIETEIVAPSFTFAIQDGIYAGQTVNCVHIHVVPRRPNDFKPNDRIYNRLEQDSILRYRSHLTAGLEEENIDINDENEGEIKRIVLSDDQLITETKAYKRRIRWFYDWGLVKKIVPFEDENKQHWLRDLYYEKFEHSANKRFIIMCLLGGGISIVSFILGRERTRRRGY